ncbi:MAG: hypothetical protein PWQ10_74 [Patescibacteria group bacterium]|nr:hypothetical protein [Patescibacteria group bacterium]
MSEKTSDSQADISINKFRSEKLAKSAEKMEELQLEEIFGDSVLGETRQDKKRFDEGSAYYKRLEEMSNRTNDYYDNPAYIDELRQGEVSEAIKSIPRLSSLDSEAKKIAKFPELISKATGSEKAELESKYKEAQDRFQVIYDRYETEGFDLVFNRNINDDDRADIVENFDYLNQRGLIDDAIEYILDEAYPISYSLEDELEDVKVHSTNEASSDVSMEDEDNDNKTLVEDDRIEDDSEAIKQAKDDDESEMLADDALKSSENEKEDSDVSEQTEADDRSDVLNDHDEKVEELINNNPDFIELMHIAKDISKFNSGFNRRKYEKLFTKKAKEIQELIDFESDDETDVYQEALNKIISEALDSSAKLSLEKRSIWDKVKERTQNLYDKVGLFVGNVAYGAGNILPEPEPKIGENLVDFEKRVKRIGMAKIVGATVLTITAVYIARDIIGGSHADMSHTKGASAFIGSYGGGVEDSANVFSPQAYTVDSGEGWYNTMNQIGITNSTEQANLLQKVGPQLQKIGWAYPMENGLWGISHPGQLPKDVLDLLKNSR